MSTYRIVVFRGESPCAPAIELSCPTDRDALWAASELLKPGQTAAVWDGERPVGRVGAPPLRSGILGWIGRLFGARSLFRS